mmetsp:Transcript_102552/g.290396  ORF Transcript_102552/g.290396 Transcript_102552/m.290396 type:complete len:293 (+) Transcript_102552:176-1054(+)
MCRRDPARRCAVRRGLAGPARRRAARGAPAGPAAAGGGGALLRAVPRRLVPRGPRRRLVELPPVHGGKGGEALLLREALPQAVHRAPAQDIHQRGRRHGRLLPGAALPVLRRRRVGPWLHVRPGPDRRLLGPLVGPPLTRARRRRPSRPVRRGAAAAAGALRVAAPMPGGRPGAVAAARPTATRPTAVRSTARTAVASRLRPPHMPLVRGVEGVSRAQAALLRRRVRALFRPRPGSGRPLRRLVPRRRLPRRAVVGLFVRIGVRALARGLLLLIPLLLCVFLRPLRRVLWRR